ncbi:Pyridoxal 5'-phosphate synthase subunit SNO1 [Spathaspora sp. JA1]|nr:Pyridoxal 5'-phosphate synthase subunit SNO1 [Spathaspora sp. JA1]
MTTSQTVTIGVLALQGAFREHIAYFNELLKENSQEYSEYEFKIIEVKTKEDLQTCDSLVIPGGESTSISYIAERTNLLPYLYEFISDETKSIWGTCAGMIFLSRQLINGKLNQKILGGLNVEVSRNAFGRQLNSFEQPLDFSGFMPGVEKFPTVFIRAPVVTRILSPTQIEQEEEHEILHHLHAEEGIIRSENRYINHAPIEVLYSLKNFDNHDHELIVAVKQGHILGISFHPELAGDYRFHKWFIDEFVLKRLGCK